MRFSVGGCSFKRKPRSDFYTGVDKKLTIRRPDGIHDRLIDQLNRRPSIHGNLEKPSAFTLIGRYQRDTQGYEDLQLMSDLRELYLGMWNGLK